MLVDDFGLEGQETRALVFFTTFVMHDLVFSSVQYNKQANRMAKAASYFCHCCCLDLLKHYYIT